MSSTKAEHTPEITDIFGVCSGKTNKNLDFSLKTEYTLGKDAI